MFIFKRIYFIGILLSLISCSSVDEYMLGKDNAPQPKPLPLLKNPQPLTSAGSYPITASGRHVSQYKLKPLVTQNEIFVAAGGGIMEAKNKQNGQPLWQKKLNADISAGPVLNKNILIVGTTLPAVVALDAASGKNLWEAQITGELLANPLVVQDKVIIKTMTGYLYAFDINTGKALWHTNHGSSRLSMQASSSPVYLKDNLILVGYADGRLDAVDLRTGKIIWQRGVAFAKGPSDVDSLVDIAATPLVEGERVYLATYQGYVGALSMIVGDFIWKRPASVINNLAMSKQNLYYIDDKDIIWALDKRSGVVKWKQKALKARGLTDPVLDGNHLIVGDKTGYLHIISADSGELLGRQYLKSAILSAPVFKDNHLYVFTQNAQLNQFNLGKG